MTLRKMTSVVYALLGVLYVGIGLGSLLLPMGWLPSGLTERFLVGETLSPFIGHLLQEFGTAILVLGCLLLWYAVREGYSPGFHWVMTAYFALDALIHWVGPEGFNGWRRGIVNTVPFLLLLMLALLRSRSERAIR